jgi:hypothetical protein
VGGVITLLFALAMILGAQGALGWRIVDVLPYLLIMPSLTAFLALNFTGSTPFTSRSGVKHEIFTYIPWMGWLAGAGLILAIALVILHLSGV